MKSSKQLKDLSRRVFIRGIGYVSLGLVSSGMLSGCKSIKERFMTTSLNLTPIEWRHLCRCVELATEALEAGDEPFGSVLVAGDGIALAEDRNRVISSGDQTRHPEFELVRWAAANMTPEERVAATVFTSGEHCPMCAAAHGWVGLGRIVYVSSSDQLVAWLVELGAPASPVRALAIREIVPSLVVEGPVPDLAEQVRELHHRFYSSVRKTKSQG